MLKTAPAVFAVEDNYQIMVPVTRECTYWVRVGGVDYFDESNGILRSRSLLHRATVPMKELEAAGEYTVCVRPLIERKPYFSTTEPVQEFSFSFRPIPEKNIRIYHISDAHNLIEEPVAKRAQGDQPENKGENPACGTGIRLPPQYSRQHHCRRKIASDRRNRF